MDGFISKCISLILVFLMLIVAPLLNVYGTHEMEGRMEILNETTEFLDKSTDKGTIDEDDYNEFALKVEAHGMVLDISVDRMIYTEVLMEDGTISGTYIAADDTSVLNPGDIVRVRLQEISVTPYRKLLTSLLRLEEPEYNLTLTKSVK